MKGIFLLSIIIVFSLLVVPLSAIKKPNENATAVNKTQTNVVYENINASKNDEKVKVLYNGKVSEYSIKDYLFGVVAAEMPALFEVEALKAQVVAAHTFYCYQKSNNKNVSYDISSDPKEAQCFISRQDATSRWGEKSQEYVKKIDDCIDAVLNEILVYNNKPIFAAYHAISSGKTNNCGDVFGKDIPYLISVDSEGDMLDNGYLSTVSFTDKEIKEKLKSVIAATDDPQDYFTDINRTDNGYVKSLKYCGKEITGSALRDLLDLRSCNFEIKFSENIFTFNVKGYGHGVGMSQIGANYLARQGKTYQEILFHYYSGAQLQKL